MRLNSKAGLIGACALMLTKQFVLGTPLPTVPTPTLGQWCSDSRAAFAYAEQNGIPVIAIWGSSRCGYSNAYDAGLSDPAFIAWRESSPYIYVYIKDDVSTLVYGKTYTFYNWMWGVTPGAPQTLDAYPFLMYYWKKDGKVIVEQRRLGRALGNYAIGSPLGAQTIALAEQYFAAYSTAPTPADAWDTNDDTRAGTINSVAFGETAAAQGPHYLNVTDTDDWMKLTGSLVGMTDYVWFTDVAANNLVSGLKAEFFVGDSTTPVATLNNLQGTFTYQATTSAPLVVRVSRNANANSAVSYRVNYRRDTVAAGKIGFKTASTSISESAGSFTIAVERSQGSVGAVDARVSLGAGTTAEPYRHGFPAGGVNLHWAAGQTGTTNLTFAVADDAIYDGNQVLQLELSILSPVPFASIADGKGTINIGILENDLPAVGQLQFVPAGDQYFANTMTVVAVEGTTITLAIERINGASSGVSAAITASAGTLSAGTLNWANKDVQATKQVTLTLPALTVAKTVTVTFTPAGTTAVYGKSTLTVLVVAAKPAFETDAETFNLTTRVALLEDIGIETQGTGSITLSRLSGLLPPGITVTYDTLNKKMVVKGVATTAGSYSAVYQLSELVGSTTIKGGTIRLAFQVANIATANPAAVAKSYSFANYAVVDPTPNKVTGLLNVTIGTTGRITAKYVYAIGYGISFSASSWSLIDPDGTLTAVMQASGYVVTVQLDTLGRVSALVTETAAGKDLLANLAPAAWSGATPATQYQGYYTVALSANTVNDGAEAFGDPNYMPLGNSYMTLSMSAYGASSGSMTYAGKLANGVPFSGSAVLLPYSGSQPSAAVHAYGQLGFFKKTGKEILSGELVIQASARETYKDYPRVIWGGDMADVADVWWDHNETVADLSYSWKYGVYGGYYSSADSLAAFYEKYATTYGSVPIVLAMQSDILPASTSYGPVELYPEAYPLTITADLISLTTPVADGTTTSLSFKKATGVFSGTFRMNFADKAGVSGRYEGVLLPAWTDSAAGGEPIKEMPFGLGASWFTDRAVFGPTTTYPIRGCPVELFPSNL